MRKLYVAAILLLVSPHVSTHAEEPMIVAHRGASRQAPQNTIPAFKLAWELGADAVEGDFRQTKDGHIVCIHDDNTGKVADRKLIINQSTLEDLRKLDVGAHHDKKYKGTTIPTIAEVLATVPTHKKIYIEIKCNESIVPKLLAEITKSGLQQKQIVLISFNKDVIRALKTKAPQYKALWLSKLKQTLTGKTTPSLATILATLQETGADGFSSSKEIITQAIIENVIKQGYEYHVWTIDDLKTARRFKKWGAQSITTNVPDHMKKLAAQ